MKAIDILFSAKKESVTTFTNIPDFIQWFISNKMPNINIKSQIKTIKIPEIENLCKFLKFVQNVKEKVEKQTIIYNQKFMQDPNPELKEALNELIRVNTGGKFLRASLVALGYYSQKEDDNYLPLATALELFQTSILIHDDIIDNATTRRGKDTIPTFYNKKYQKPLIKDSKFNQTKQNFSNSMAICLGDYGFYISTQIIVESYQNNILLSKLLTYYNDVIIKTCKGEMLDIILPFKEQYFTKKANLEQQILQIYKLKTAWYSVIGPYCLGLILSGNNTEIIKKMEEILLDLGIAFQIKDDLLGIFGDEKSIGKSTNSDIEEYKQTILYAYTMTTKYQKELSKYYGKKTNKETLNQVKQIFINSGAKDYAETKMYELFNSSQSKLENINIKQKDILQGFITYLQAREK